MELIGYILLFSLFVGFIAAIIQFIGVVYMSYQQIKVEKGAEKFSTIYFFLLLAAMILLFTCNEINGQGYSEKWDSYHLSKKVVLFGKLNG